MTGKIFKFLSMKILVKLKIWLKLRFQYLLKDEVGNTTVTLKLIRSNRWKIYDLDYQTISIVGMEKMGYDSKIKRQGIEKLIQKMLNNLDICIN